MISRASFSIWVCFSTSFVFFSTYTIHHKIRDDFSFIKRYFARRHFSKNRSRSFVSLHFEKRSIYKFASIVEQNDLFQFQKFRLVSFQRATNLARRIYQFCWRYCFLFFEIITSFFSRKIRNDRSIIKYHSNSFFEIIRFVLIQTIIYLVLVFYYSYIRDY